MKQKIKEKLEKRSTELAILIISIAVVGTAAQTTDTNILDAGTSSSDRLVAEYRFDTGSGNTAYDTAGNNNGTINGASWIEGVEGKALKFDGSDDYVSTNIDIDDYSSKGFTVSAWAKLESNGNFKTILGSRSGNQFFFRANDEDRWSIGTYDGSSSYRILGPEADIGKYQHIVGIYTGNEYRLYVDGKLVGKNEATFVTNDVDEWIGGENSGSNERFKGELDRLKIYSKALNNSQIKTLYNSGSWRIGTVTDEDDPSKVAEFSFQHQNSSHVLDTSSYNNHGKRMNGVGQESAVDCKVGRCYSFDGSDDYIEVDSTSELPVDDESWTASFWIYPRSGMQGSNRNGWVLWRGSGPEDTLLSVGAEGNDWEIAHWSNDWDTNVDIEFNEWQHISVVYNSSIPDGQDDEFVYKNRLLANSQEAGNLSLLDENLYIGRANDGDNPADAKIDQVKIFNRSLSQQEIIEETQGLEGSGTVLDLRFNRDGGDKVHDYSGEDNHGTRQPNESEGPGRINGIKGEAVDFYGDEDRVQISDDSSLGSMETITISAWVKPDSLSGRDDLVKKGGSYWFNIQDNGELSTYLNGIDPNPGYYQSNSKIKVDEWTHIAFTYNGSQIRQFIDGDLDKIHSGLSGSVSSSNKDLRLGEHNGGGIDGSLDNIKIYPYAVSDSKVQQLYSLGKSHVGSSSSSSSTNLQNGLVLSQSFDRVETCGQSDTVSCPSGMSGEVAVDESGEANHGELVNVPSVKGAEDCRVGGCIGFDGSDSVIELNDLGGFGDSITVSGWIRPEEVSDKGVIFSLGDWHETRLNVENGLQWQLSNGSSSSLEAITGSTVTDNDKWYFVTATADLSQDEWKIYVDGKQVASDNPSVNELSSSDSPDVIGSFDAGGANEIFNGSIDQVRVYNRSLSKQEVWNLYTHGRDRESGMAGPVGQWDFSSRYGRSIYDRSSEGNTGDWNSNGPASEKRYIVNEYHDDLDLSVIAYEDDTEIRAGDCTKTLQKGVTKSFDSSCYSVTDTVSSKRAFSAHWQQSGSDGPVPASFAGKEFVYEDCRDADYFNIVSPYNSASVSIKNASGTIMSTTVSEGGHKEINPDIQKDDVYTIESDSRILVTYDRSIGDVYMMQPASDNLWGLIEDLMVSKDNTYVEVYDSDGNKVTDGVFNKYDHIGLSQGGGQGGSESHRAIANSSALGGSRCADADDGETDIAISNNNMAKEFRLPEPVEGKDGDEYGDYYLTFTAPRPATCSVSYPNGSLAAKKSSSNSPPNPGFMTFDTAEDFNITSEGAKVSCTEPVALQWEPSDNPGESNLYGIDTRTRGRSGNGLEFDGKDDYVRSTVDMSIVGQEDPFTVTGWFKTTDGSSALFGFTNKVFGSDSNAYLRTNGGKVSWQIEPGYEGGGNTVAQTSKNYDDGEWHHVAGLRDGGYWAIYTDGELAGKENTSNFYEALKSNSKLEFGAYRERGAYLKGKVDDVRVYPYALSEERIKQIMNSGVVSIQ